MAKEDSFERSFGDFQNITRTKELRIVPSSNGEKNIHHNCCYTTSDVRRRWRTNNKRHKPRFKKHLGIAANVHLYQNISLAVSYQP